MAQSIAEIAQANVGVVLGWALGLASAGILGWRKTKKRDSAARAAILMEFDELAYRMAGVVLKVESQAGRLDRPLLEWLETATDRYSGPNRVDLIPSNLAQMLKTPDADLKRLNAVLKAKPKSAFYPAEQAPYATATVAQAHEFEPEFALAVMDVLSHLRMYNEVRENGLHYTFMTFEPGLDLANHVRISQNAESADLELSKRARAIVDKIDSFARWRA